MYKWPLYLIEFLLRHLKQRLSKVQFMIVMAVITGLVAGLAAVLLKLSVHYLQTFLASKVTFSFFYLLFPAIGIMICAYLIHRFYGGQFERGVAMVLKSIARRSSYIGTRHNYIHMITSSITVGMGGSAGLEAPIVATGSTIGSTVGRVNGMSYQERTLLIACGAAAGISAVFNAPIAGVIFAIEILLSETIVSYFIPLIISSVTGVLCSKIILDESVLINFFLKESFNYHNVPFYILLGIGGGFISLYYARVFKKTEKQFEKSKLNYLTRAALGGMILVGLYFVFPPLFGEGYESVKQLANDNSNLLTANSFLLTALPDNWELLLFVGAIVLIKPIATAITIGAGGYGGNFAPSLFTGAFWGFFFSKLVNLSGWFKVPESNFTLTGMAAVLSGVMYCPLSAIFLIAEITNGYQLFVPLMITSSLSYFIVKHFEPFSMDTKELAASGKMFTHEKEKNILSSIELSQIIQKPQNIIKLEAGMPAFLDTVRQSDQQSYIVEDSSGAFAGVIELSDIKPFLFSEKEVDEVSLHEIIREPLQTVYMLDSMDEVMKKFERTQKWQLPVLDANKQCLGMASKFLLFEKYRELLGSQKDLYEL